MIFLLQPPSNLQLFLQSFTNKTTHLQKNQDPNVKNTTGLCLLHTILFKPLSLLFFIVHTQGQKSAVIGSWPCLPDGKKQQKRVTFYMEGVHTSTRLNFFFPTYFQAFKHGKQSKSPQPIFFFPILNFPLHVVKLVFDQTGCG